MNMKKIVRRYWWIFALALVLMVAGGVWSRMQAGKNKPQFDTAGIDRGTIVSTVNTTGTVNAVISVDIGSQVSGKVTKLYVDFNSHVKKGQVLAQMDPLVYQAQADEANANVNSARATAVNYQAQYENALAKVRGAQAAIKNSEAQVEVARANLVGAQNNQKSARANLAKAEAQLENDRVEFKRASELMKQDFISHTDMDAAETKYKVSLANVDVVRASFEQATSGVRSSQMQLNAAQHSLESSRIEEQSQMALSRAIQAQVKQAQAQIMNASGKLREAMVNLSYTNIISPIDGVVVGRSVDVGQTVAASFQAPKLFTLAKDLRDMEVYANVDEADIGKVKQGLEATFTVDAFQGEKFPGHVRQVRKASIMDQGVVKYQVILSAKNPDLKLMPGMTANVTIISETKDDVLRIPNGAIRFRPESVPNFPYPADAKEGKIGKNGKSGKGGTGGPGARGEKRQGPGGDAARFSSIWLIDEQGKVRQAKVLLGITDGQYTEMKKGSVKEGQSVILGTLNGKSKASTAAPRAGGGGVRIFH
jgi:HlyD family secretion protein